jgi:hypothetical protein
MTMRHALRRDGNDAIITEALRKAGFTVTDFGKAGQGIPDKLVTRALPDGTPWVCWVEIKMPKGRLREAQEAFRATFEPRGEYYVARDPEEAVRELYDRYIAAIRPELMR